MKNIYIYMLLVVIAAACVNKNNIISVDYTIQMKPNCNEIVYSEIFGSIKYVLLQTNKDYMLGNIKKTIIKNKRIYLLDESNKGIYVFNFNGEFLFKIQKLGKGPGEYDNIDDFTVNANDSTIEVLDSNKRKITKYDSAGNYLASFMFKHYTAAFEQIYDNQYIFATLNSINDANYKYNLLITDSLGNIKSGLCSINKRLENYSYKLGQELTKYNKVIYAYPSFSDTVYKIDNGIIKRHVFLDYQQERDFYKTFAADDSRDVKNNKLKRSNYYKTPYYYLENDNTIYMTYSRDGKPVYTFYNKSKNIAKSSTKIVNDIDDIPFLGFVAISDKHMINVYDSHIISMLKEAGKKNKNILKIFPRILNNVTDMSNPIIVFYEIKQ